jgi:hypothetical protein
VLVIVTITKFTHGAWLVFLAIPVLSFLMIGVHRYYRDVEHEIEMDDDVHFGASGDVAIVLVGKLQKPVAKAIDYALAAKHDKTIAVHIAVTNDDARAVQDDWAFHHMPVPLLVIESPYRQYAAPLAQFITQYREKHGRPSSPSTCRSTSSVTGGRACCTTGAPAASRSSSCSCTACRSRSCRGCSTRRSSSTAAARARCPATTAPAASRRTAWWPTPTISRAPASPASALLEGGAYAG